MEKDEETSCASITDGTSDKVYFTSDSCHAQGKNENAFISNRKRIKLKSTRACTPVLASVQLQ